MQPLGDIVPHTVLHPIASRGKFGDDVVLEVVDKLVQCDVDLRRMTDAKALH